VKNTVLMSLVAAAGLASTVQGQTAQYGVQLVLDNDPILASLGINYGTNALLPGPTATAVGITLLARVAVTGGPASLGNFGIAAMGGGGSSTAGNSRFSHTDAISNQTTALWSSPALAFQRGVSNSSGSQRGLMNVTTSPQTPDNRAVSFRSLLSGNSNNNSATNNATGSTNPTDVPYSTGVNNANGWIGTVGGSGQIVAVTAQRQGVPSADGGGDPLPNFTNYGTTGAFSPWYALYHFVFVPRANNGGTIDVTRNVTVNFSGYFRYGNGSNETAGNWNLTTSSLSSAQTGSVTFQVPTPGAMALLGLGGLVAGRRRRA
jgi:MYXO-CTERM domain-containing protein